MSKKARFVVNPQQHTVIYISEGEAVKNPKKLIEKTQKFYKSKGINIPITVFENAYKKEMILEKKIYFAVNPTNYTVEFINEAKINVDKQLMAENASKFFNKTNYKIPKNVFMEAIDEAENAMPNYNDTTDELISQFIQTYGLETEKTNSKFINALKIVLPTLQEKGIEIKQLNSSMYENANDASAIQAPSEPNKEVHAEINPSTGKVVSQKIVNKGTPVSGQNTIVVKNTNEDVDMGTSEEYSYNTNTDNQSNDVTLAGLTHRFAALVDNIAKIVTDRFADDNDTTTLEKLNKIKAEMAQIIAKKDPNAALTHQAINTGNDNMDTFMNFDDANLSEEIVNKLIKMLAEKRNSVTIYDILESVAEDSGKRKIIFNTIERSNMSEQEAYEYARKRGYGNDTILFNRINAYFHPDVKVREVETPQTYYQQYKPKK